MEMKTEKKERAKKRDSKSRRPGFKKKKGSFGVVWSFGGGRRKTHYH